MDPLKTISLLSGLEVPFMSEEEAEELGTLQPATKAKLVELAKTKAKQVQTQLRASQMTRHQVRFAVAASAQLPEKEKVSIANNEKAADHFHFFRAAQVASFSGTVHFWDQTNDEAVGLSNLDKNVLPEGTNMLISHIGIEYGYDAGGAVNNAALINYENFTTVPVGVANGYLKMTIAGQEVINNLLIGPNFFANDAGAVLSEINRDVKFFEVDRDNILWKWGQAIKIDFTFPDGANVAPYQPAGDHYLRFHLYGPGMRNR